MGHDLTEILGVEGVQDVEEVLSRWALARWVLVGEVLGELGVLDQHGPESFDAQLVIMWNFDRGHLLLQEQMLFTTEHVSQEIFVHHSLVGQHVLDWKKMRNNGIVYLRCLSR